MVTPLHSRPGRWVPPGEPTAVGGHAISGGLLYVGGHLPSTTGPVEAALINPALPVATSSGRPTAPAGGPNLAYHLLSPVTRKAYLDWLAGGRRSDVAPGLVLLFCFGLERRVLLDDDPELSAITAEVRRLRLRYGDAPALREPLDNLLDLLELLTAPRTAPGAEPDRQTPTVVRVGLARFAVSAAPLPVAWAHAWLRQQPSGPRRSEIDCPAEFERLFTMRYRERYGRGLVISRDGGGIRLRYRPAHPGLAPTLVWRADLPDLLGDPGVLRPLAGLRDETAADLDPYRRWLARFPQGRDSLAAVPLLPAELVDARHGTLGALRVWAERRLDGQPRVLIDAAELGDFWSAADPERMTTDEATALLCVLARLGLGVEPDVRFGAPPLARGPAALFRLAEPAADRPGPRFAAAAAIARCAAAVAAAAGPVDPPRPAGSALTAGTALPATAAELADALHLAPGEDTRLAARLSWLLTTRVELDRLSRHTAAIAPGEREIAGHYLITVAVAADPVISPATVAALTRVYRILGLPVDLVFPRLHERGTGATPSLTRSTSARSSRPEERRFRQPETGAGPHFPEPRFPEPRFRQPEAGAGPRFRQPEAGAGPMDEPVVVQAGHDGPTGYALPWAMADEPAPPTGLRLDHALVRRKVAESDTAAALLSTIFEEEAADSPPEPPVVPGLDPVHSALLRALGERTDWPRADFETLAAAYGVLPDGALDVLNEAAIDAAGAPVVEGDTILTVATDVLQELFA